VREAGLDADKGPSFRGRVRSRHRKRIGSQVGDGRGQPWVSLSTCKTDRQMEERGGEEGRGDAERRGDERRCREDGWTSNDMLRMVMVRVVAADRTIEKSRT
jgi:hypothetical protein